MAELIEFPACEAAPNSLPNLDDRYRAYDSWEDFEPPTIAFVFEAGSINGLSYSTLHGYRFRPLGDPWDCDGDCEIVLTFGDLRDTTDVIVMGRNLYGLVWDLGERRVNWIWELPKGRGAADGSPVVRSIKIRERKTKAATSLLGWFRLHRLASDAA